jgi:hypothetical protein
MDKIVFKYKINSSVINNNKIYWKININNSKFKCIKSRWVNNSYSIWNNNNLLNNNNSLVRVRINKRKNLFRKL